MAVALAGGVSVAAQTTALASSRTTAVQAADTCAYPYVCLFKNGVKIGQFQDVTSTWQNLPSRPSGPGLVVQNTRNDDVAHIRWSGGATTCIPPNSSFGVTGGTLTGIRISSAATC
ncbi:hypothetical protein OHA98_21890 [Streptomyces sp. NBC_00654]|uniref:hypothetical protein n=1 Tax=Streptomyces sp. NBC_00654 TaxID=2975799 RepID=UPI00225C37A8|nr:hypothetical protein [Streptomyces sp. NBC_00654]MCX4967367.1 hypothetical protein [Streptomyces sp. NBC_00654]